MGDYKVYRSSKFDENDPTLYNWTLDAHFDDGAVAKTKIDMASADQIAEACKASLRGDEHVEVIFLWCDTSWWGSVSRL